MKNDALNQASGAYGSLPIATGAQTVDIPCTSFEADEDTTFGVFKDSSGTELLFHPWKGKTVSAGKSAWFGQSVASFTITAGGKGQGFLASDEMPTPVLLTAATSTNGALVILTFDRVMSNPAAYAADFQVKRGSTADVVTAAALGTNTKTIELTLTTAAVHSSVVTMSILYGHIMSSWGAKLQPVTDIAVTNNVP